jgi:hypothetical protein
MSGMFDDNWGIWRFGIPGFHELDQHLEAPLLPGVRIMVTLSFCVLFLLLMFCYYFLFSFLFPFFINYWLLRLLFPLYFAFLYLHSIGLWALLSLFHALFSCLGGLHFHACVVWEAYEDYSCVAIFAWYLAEPLCCRIRRTIHTPVFCFTLFFFFLRFLTFFLTSLWDQFILALFYCMAYWSGCAFRRYRWETVALVSLVQSSSGRLPFCLMCFYDWWEYSFLFVHYFLRLAIIQLVSFFFVCFLLFIPPLWHIYGAKRRKGPGSVFLSYYIYMWKAFFLHGYSFGILVSSRSVEEASGC